MARCSNCNAPLSPGSIVCEYCNNRNDIDLHGVHFYTVNEVYEPRICPRCDIKLKPVDLKLKGRFLIDRCTECLGIFFDPGELEALIDITVGAVHNIDRAGINAINENRNPNQHPVSYLKCPVCTRLMHRSTFGFKSGVIMDHCNDHGIWLDGGELRQILEWVKLGGRLLEKERDDRQRSEVLSQERELLRMQQLQNRDLDDETDIWGARQSSYTGAKELVKLMKKLWQLVHK